MVEHKIRRQFKALRLSITGDCNLACTYCVPAKRCEPRHVKELSAKKIVKALKLLVNVAGIEKVRLTGGEPLISSKLNVILPQLSKLPLKDISLTTNAQLLERKAMFLRENGLQRINISLDSLDPKKYESITRGGVLQKTLNGIEKALEIGLKLKINMVPVRQMNEDEIIDVLDFCLDRGIELRYIELMQMGHLTDRKKHGDKFISMDYIFGQIRQKYTFEPVSAPLDSTAIKYLIPNRGHFGVIANDSAPFCNNCNRLRFSADGYLYGCLSSQQKFPVSDILELPDEMAARKLRSILTAALATKQEKSFNGSSLLMKSVGG